MAAVRRYPLAPRQHVFFEYVLLDGVNDSPEDASGLVRLLRGVPAKVNLIPFNDWEGSGFRRPPLPRILAFQRGAAQGRGDHDRAVEQGRGYRRRLRTASRGRARLMPTSPWPPSGAG